MNQNGVKSRIDRAQVQSHAKQVDRKVAGASLEAEAMHSKVVRSKQSSWTVDAMQAMQRYAKDHMYLVLTFLRHHHPVMPGISSSISIPKFPYSFAISRFLCRYGEGPR